MNTQSKSTINSLNLQDILNSIAQKKIIQLQAAGISQEKIQKLIPNSVASNASVDVQSTNLEYQFNNINYEVWESEGGSTEDFSACRPRSYQIDKLSDTKYQREYKPVQVWEDFLSEEQRAAVNYFKSGKSGCMIGKAGTGKTTAVKQYAKELQQEHLAIPMQDTDGHKYLKQGSLGIVCCAFTNKAINNISKSFDLAATQINFMTIHKLLEFIKEEYQYLDKDTKELRQSFRFVPSRNRLRKLPYGLHTIVIEEASMVSIELYKMLIDACHQGIQFIFLGDLQQLPPPYGEGILGYKLNELPCFELTKIYRQAAENPIISLAWDISNGIDLARKVLESKYHKDKSLSAPIRFSFFEKKIAWEYACVTMGNFFCQLIDKKIFNPDLDVILVPYNKQLGSIALNSTIAQHLSEEINKQETYEIIAGFQKHYYAIGDKVLYNKKEGYITKITRNAKYVGKSPLTPSLELHRDGMYHAKSSSGAILSPEEGMTEEQMDAFLLAALNSDDDVTNQASHILDIRLVAEQMEDGSTITTVSTRGEYANLILAYAITVHKAQGSEWRKVFLLLHNSHHQVNRELLYTAVTRASQQLFVMCEPDSFSKGISRQRIPGVTLQEKILWFKTKIEEMKRAMELAKKADKIITVDETENEE